MLGNPYLTPVHCALVTWPLSLGNAVSRRPQEQLSICTDLALSVLGGDDQLTEMFPVFPVSAGKGRVISIFCPSCTRTEEKAALSGRGEVSFGSLCQGHTPKLLGFH